MSQIIPAAALNQHIAILGKTGSGKTSTAKWLVEKHVADGARVCVLDPIKSDWWGLTSSSTGKAAGLPFSILGGPKQHAPLPARSGAVIGALVASGELPLSIIDMAEFTPKEMSAWYLEFAEALFRRMAGVLILVMEEADIFAPKEMLGNRGGENMRLHWSSRLGRAGRSKGIRLVMNCTRVQKIHNDMLGSCETLIAHRFTTPADRKPIIEWLSVNAEKSIVKEIEGSLSSLKNGEGWVCYPEGGHIQRTQFPRISTYDNSKTPAHGDSSAQVKTAAIDIDALKGKLGEAAKEAEANDPKLLRQQIAELKKQLGGKAPSAVDHQATERSVAAAIAARDREWKATIASHERVIGDFKGRLGKIASLAHVNGEAVVAAPLKVVVTNPIESRRPIAVTPEPARETKRSAGGDLTGPQQAILDVIATLDARGIPANRDSIARWLDIHPNGGSYGTNLGYLRSSGYLEGCRLTEKGQSAAQARETGLEAAIAALPDEPKRKIMRTLVDAGGPLNRDELASLLGIHPNGGSYGTNLGRLRTMGLITERGPIQVTEGALA